MAGARTLAMSVNRLADRSLDARNPRTAGRHLPTGLLTPGQVTAAAGGPAAVLLLSPPVPARFGVAAALRTAQICHGLTVAAFAALGWALGLGWLYWVGVLAVAGLLIYEHSLVSPEDLSRLDVAFFNVNGYIAVILFF